MEQQNTFYCNGKLYQYHHQISHNSRTYSSALIP